MGSLENLFVGVIVGVISGLLVVIIVKVMRTIPSWIQSFHYRGYVGNYHVYNYRSDRTDRIAHSKLEIKRVFGKLKSYEEGGGFQFSGSVTLTDRIIYIFMKGVRNEERVQYVLHHPMNRKICYLWAVACGVSVNGDPTVWRILISDEQLTHDKVRHEFQQTKTYLLTDDLKVKGIHRHLMHVSSEIPIENF